MNKVKSHSNHPVRDDFKGYLQQEGKSKSTIKHYQYYLLDFITWLDTDNTEIENVTAKEVLAYLSYLQKKGQSNKTRNIRLNVIKHYFNWKIEQGRLSTNVAKHIKLRGTDTKKVYPLFNRQELEKLYNNYIVPTADDPNANRNWFTAYQLSKSRNKVILSLLINQGLTTAEINRLLVSDLKLRDGEIDIAGARKGAARKLKLKSHQIIDLMEYTLQVRQQFVSYQIDSQTNRLFLSVPKPGQTKAKKDSLSIWKGLSTEVKKIHPQFINFYQVRASVITGWLKQYNLREVQYMAGHKKISVTERYLINSTEDLQEAIDKFHPF